MIPKKTTTGSKLLELTMQDVLDGLGDAATYMNYQSIPETVEILSIGPADQLLPPHSEVIQLAQRPNLHATSQRSSDIVDYLLQRELRRTA